MKYPILMLAIFFLLVSCNKSDGIPQFLSSEGEGEGGQASGLVSAVENLLSEKAGVRNLIYHIGPVDLPAGSSAEDMLDEPLVMNFHFDEPSWVIGFEPKVVNMSGEELPDTLLFQAIISNMAEENPVCPGGSVGNPFIAASSIMTSIHMPDGYAYPILETDSLKAEIVLHNPTEESYIDVSFEINIAVKPMNEFTGMRDLSPMLLDVEPCTHRPYRVEPENFVERRAIFNIPYDGNLLVGHGLLQNYASYVELYKKDEVVPFWRSEGLLDEGHNLIDLTDNPFEDPNGIGFRSGDAITLGVGYDNTGTTWLNEATAAAMVYFARP